MLKELITLMELCSKSQMNVSQRNDWYWIRIASWNFKVCQLSSHMVRCSKMHFSNFSCKNLKSWLRTGVYCLPTCSHVAESLWQETRPCANFQWHILILASFSSVPSPAQPPQMQLCLEQTKPSSEIRVGLMERLPDGAVPRLVVSLIPKTTEDQY